MGLQAGFIQKNHCSKLRSEKRSTLRLGVFCYNQYMRKILFIILLLLTACSANPNIASLPTSTSVPLAFATATLVPTFTPRPSATQAPPTIVATIDPVSAVLTSQVNVRAQPDKNAKSLGLANYGTRVQVVGKDVTASWWQIVYPENSSTTGWVSATYVQLSSDDAKKIPVIQLDTNTSTPVSLQDDSTVLATTPETTPTVPAHTATVTKQIFVRVGPGQTFASIGTVNSGMVVNLTGRNQNNVWVQVQFETGTDGKGWVAAAYLDGAVLNGLPFFDNEGSLIFEGTPNANPGQQTLTPTAFSPAAADGDSQQSPAVSLNFSPDGAREFTFISDLSSPSGDDSDWVAISPYEPTNQSTFLYFRLDCSGNGGITATLEKDGLPVLEVKPVLCGNYDVAIKVLGGAKYFLVLRADGSGGPLRYVHYTLNIKSLR